MSTTTSEAVTRGIRVNVRAKFSDQNSDPQGRRWVFLYTITISNESAVRVQLLERHWIITDANGDVEEVKGPGVVGKQVVLNGQNVTVVGVAPREFRSNMPMVEPVLWIPLMQLTQVRPGSTNAAFENRGNNYLNVVARLKPG